MLKKYLLLIIFIISTLNFVYSYQNKFSTLDWQIINNSDKNNREQSISKLKDYLSVMNPEIEKGMKMVLFENHFTKLLKTEQTKIEIDGYDNEWKNIHYELIDEEGNTKEPTGDLVLFKCKLDKDYNLYTMHKAVKAIAGDTNTQYIIEMSFKGGGIRVQYQLDGQNSQYIYNGKEKKIDIKFAVNRVGEAVFPLKKIFEESLITFPDRLEIRPMIWNIKNGLIEKKRGNRRWVYNNFDFPFDKMYIDVTNNNFALLLLLHLINNNCYIPGDSITLALALANNVIYSISDIPARQQIKQDIIKHFHFYKKITELQKNWDIKFNFQKAPLIPKIYWANRSNTYETENGVLTLKYYNEFIDKIEMLEDYHKIATENELNKGNSFRIIAGKVFRFVLDRHRYRAGIALLKERNRGTLPADIQQDIDSGDYYKYYFGKKRYWNEFGWMNYQHNLYKKTGFTKGCCGTYTPVQAVIFKSMGISAHAMYIITYKINETTNSIDTHLFVKYYNPFFDKWDSFIGKNVDNNLDLYLYVYRINWHHLENTFENKYIEKTTNANVYKNLLDNGIDNDLIEKIFLTNMKTKVDFLFNKKNAPETIVDSDADGISNIHEQKYVTNPNNPDSDNDGYSDLWEIEHGFNPRDSNSPLNKNILAIDGLTEKYISLNHIPTINFNKKIKTNTIKNGINVIRSLSAKKIGSNIYVGVTFFDSWNKKTDSLYTFRFDFMKNNQSKRYVLQIYENGAALYLDGKRISLNNINYCRNNDFEALIPMSIFEMPIEKLKIIYYWRGNSNIHYKEINKITVLNPLDIKLD